MVKNPLPVPDRIDKQLHILSPENGDVFIAYNGKVQIYPKANQAMPLHSFLNGVLQNAAEWPLEVSNGHYQLRCVDQNGNSSAIAFSVR